MSVRVTTLPNGLRVVTDPMATVETVSVGAWVEAGTRDEHLQVNGVSHFLEHMAFKGTRRRSARAIAEEIEAVGGHLNAYTAREHTAYYAKVLKEDLALAVDIIADILQFSTLDDDEVARERAVILQEIHQTHDTPDDMVFDHFQEVAYPNQPLGRTVLGEMERIRDMPRDILAGYMQERYSAGRMVLSAAGRVDHDRFVEMAARAFDSLPAHREFRREAAAYGGGERREARELEQVHMVLGFEGIPYTSRDFYTMSVLSTLLGGGMSSRLFQEARENRGLVYSIYSFLSCYTDSGLFGIYAGTGADEVAELMPLICDEVVKVREDVSEDEVVRARTQLKASILMALESSSSRCETRARHLLIFGRPLLVEELVAHIDTVTPEAVRAAARSHLRGTPTLAVIGPHAKVPALDVLERALA